MTYFPRPHDQFKPFILFYYFILFCSINQQSQAVAIHIELDRKDTEH